MTPEELHAAEARVRNGHCLLLGPDGRPMPESASQPKPQKLYGWSAWEHVNVGVRNSWGAGWDPAALNGDFSAPVAEKPKPPPATTEIKEVKGEDELMSALLSGCSVMAKDAIDAINDFTRKKLKEDGFFRKILPPIQISDDELDQQVSAGEPVQAVSECGAFSIPFGTLPTSAYIKGPMYKVLFDKIEPKTWILEGYVLCQNDVGEYSLCSTAALPAAASSSPASSCPSSRLQDSILHPPPRRALSRQRTRATETPTRPQQERQRLGSRR